MPSGCIYLLRRRGFICLPVGCPKRVSAAVGYGILSLVRASYSHCLLCCCACRGRWLFCPGGVGGGGLSCELFAFPVEPLRSVTDARPVAVVRPCCPATFFVVSSIGDLCLVLEFLFSWFLARWRCFVSLSGWVVSVSLVSFRLSGRFVLWLLLCDVAATARESRGSCCVSFR